LPHTHTHKYIKCMLTSITTTDLFYSCIFLILFISTMIFMVGHSTSSIFPNKE